MLIFFLDFKNNNINTDDIMSMISLKIINFKTNLGKIFSKYPIKNIIIVNILSANGSKIEPILLLILHLLAKNPSKKSQTNEIKIM